MGDPLVAAFRAIEVSAVSATADLDKLIDATSGKVREFLVAARDVRFTCGAAAREAADAVERAEAMVQSRHQ